jgi:hypothetical protein
MRGAALAVQARLKKSVREFVFLLHAPHQDAVSFAAGGPKGCSMG